jgi:hypothetical protein
MAPAPKTQIFGETGMLRPIHFGIMDSGICDSFWRLVKLFDPHADTNVADPAISRFAALSEWRN